MNEWYGVSMTDPVDECGGDKTTRYGPSLGAAIADCLNAHCGGQREDALIVLAQAAVAYHEVRTIPDGLNEELRRMELFVNAALDYVNAEFRAREAEKVP